MLYCGVAYFNLCQLSDMCVCCSFITLHVFLILRTKHSYKDATRIWLMLAYTPKPVAYVSKVAIPSLILRFVLILKACVLENIFVHIFKKRFYFHLRPYLVLLLGQRFRFWAFGTKIKNKQLVSLFLETSIAFFWCAVMFRIKVQTQGCILFCFLVVHKFESRPISALHIAYFALTHLIYYRPIGLHRLR